ncbi:hypothetical protein SAMN05661096_03577 [Marivirga sericea]|uniref:Aspartyl protease n=1 Tax=Marivirga sericea TaxID=1028 RepID=A0A1X7L5Q2_9BACT|nr:hypothetical protein [Marivirga sericea]SMG49181.1 hypothetical protein SAMN05661096_03577 [Marivirga sericea]
MNKKLKILAIVGVFIVTLLFTGWQVFNYYWRTRGTINTFHSFSEPDTISYTDIRWVEDSYGPLKTNIGAFFVKVKLNGIDDSFYMQFDTGTSQSLLYGKTLNTLKQKYPSFEPVKSQSGSSWLESPNLVIGKLSFDAEKILALDDLGSDEIDSSFIIIGTIGFDAIVGRKLILDFKNNRLTITNKDINNLGFSFTEVAGASIDRFPILIPAVVNENKVQLSYDTGSSMFPLVVDNQKLIGLKNAEPIDTLCCVTSWGKSFNFYRRKLNTSIKIGELTEEKPYVYSSNAMEQYSIFPSWLMMGLTGNQMFLNKVILVDTENNIFGINN